MRTPILPAFALLLLCGMAVEVWGQDVEGLHYAKRRKFVATTPTPYGPATVVSDEYYQMVYVDPVVQYRYPAWQALGDGVHYKRIAEPGWRMVKVGETLYVFGPGYSWANCTPFAYGPGGVVVGAYAEGRTTIPVAGNMMVFLLNLLIGR